MSISPKAMRTDWCISASGGAINPAVSMRHPKTHSVTDSINWIFFIVFLFLFPRISRIFTDFISTFISDGLCRSRECFRYLIPPVGSRYILLQLAVSPFIRFSDRVSCKTIRVAVAIYFGEPRRTKWEKKRFIKISRAALLRVGAIFLISQA